MAVATTPTRRRWWSGVTASITGAVTWCARSVSGRWRDMYVNNARDARAGRRTLVLIYPPGHSWRPNANHKGCSELRQEEGYAGSLDSRITMEDLKLREARKPKTGGQPLLHFSRAKQKAALLQLIRSVQPSVSSWGQTIYHSACTAPFLQG